MKFLFFIIFLMLIACNENEQYTPPVAGYYGKHIVLAYNESSKEISGIYQSNINTQESTADSCYFYFVGKFAGKKTNIISWRIGHRLTEIFGIMTMEDSLSFDLSFERTHVNCAIHQGLSDIYTLDKKTDWRYIRTVKKEWASVHADSNPTPLDTTFRKGTIMYVLDKKIDWVETTNGWMREEDLIRFPG